MDSVTAAGNADTPLTDPTGNRRFLPVRLKRAVDMAWVRANRDQLLGEACAREAAGETFRIRKALWQIAAEHQERAREKPAWEERLEDELCEEVGAGYVLSGDVQNFVDSFEKRPVPSSLWRAVMDRLKFEPYQARPEPGQKKRRLWVRSPYTDETPRLTLSRYDLPPMPSRQTADQPAAGGTEEPIAQRPRTDDHRCRRSTNQRASLERIAPSRRGRLVEIEDLQFAPQRTFPLPWPAWRQP